jgi:DNA-binding response OmpR family regulator
MASTGERILIIEDDQTALGILADYLMELGYQVVTASDGLSGLEEFHRQRPSLVLLNLGLPRMNGFEVLRRIKDSGLEVPVVVMSVMSDDYIVRQAMRTGAVEFVAKPIELERLKELILRLI